MIVLLLKQLLTGWPPWPPTPPPALLLPALVENMAPVYPAAVTAMLLNVWP